MNKNKHFKNVAKRLGNYKKQRERTALWWELNWLYMNFKFSLINLNKNGNESDENYP